jgi:hypothetical protein
VIEVNVPLKQLHFGRLKTELIAAGVPQFPGELKPIYAGQDRLIFRLPDGTDPGVATRVIADHVDTRTPTQIKRERLVESLAATDTQSERLKVVIRVLYKSLVETRAWCNQVADSLQAAGMPTPPRLRNRTWEEAVQAVIEEIETAELLDPNPVMMENPFAEWDDDWLDG